MNRRPTLTLFQRESAEKRFAKYADPVRTDTGCLLWKGNAVGKGYGTFTVVSGWSQTAHVVAWRIAHNWRNVPRGWVVRHRCDNPPCVEPTHLVIGTHRQNFLECLERGRRPSTRGESVLTDDMVRLGRALVEEGRLTQRELADLWGISRPVVSRLVRRVTYRSVS